MREVLLEMKRLGLQMQLLWVSSSLGAKVSSLARFGRQPRSGIESFTMNFDIPQFGQHSDTL